MLAVADRCGHRSFLAAVCAFWVWCGDRGGPSTVAM